MKTIFLLLALVLPTWGWATELSVTTSEKSVCTFTSEDGQTHVAKVLSGVVSLETVAGFVFDVKCRPVKDVQHDRDCLEKMQAAMEAMEPFLLLNFEGVFQVNLNIVQPDQYGNYWAVLPAEKDLHTYTPYGLTQLWNVKAARAIVLWDQAKRDCWRAQ